MDKKCLLTFFSVPLIFINYLYTNNLCIYSIFIRRATKRGKKYSSERKRLRIYTLPFIVKVLTFAP